MKSLIIGNGQIGSALFEIFSKVHETHVRDFEAIDLEGVEVLHIAYPYSDKFVEQTKQYIEQYKPMLTIIHSTVAIGTTRQVGGRIVHSPERGRFPNLAKEMLLYKKFIGGVDHYDCLVARRYFELCKWNSVILNNPETTEALKLISNAHMGLEIAWRQEVERFGIKEKDYRLWEDSYFSGYIYLGQHELIRSRMLPGPIGGHCILPSIDILLQSFNSPCLEYVKESNGLAKGKTKVTVS